MMQRVGRPPYLLITEPLSSGHAPPLRIRCERARPVAARYTAQVPYAPDVHPGDMVDIEVAGGQVLHGVVEHVTHVWDGGQAITRIEFSRHLR